MPKLLIALVGLLAFTQDPQQPTVFRGVVNTVSVHVTVTDKSGRLVPDLTKENFEVRDNGKPQPLTQFDNTPQPISIVVLLDVSGSMRGNLRLLRDSCDQLFTRLRPDDRAKVGTFGAKITISPTFTNDINTLHAALPTTIDEMGGTPLWRSIDQAIGELQPVTNRKVVLVLSDSKDSGPMFGQKWVAEPDVSDRAQREEVMIYGIGIQSRGMNLSMTDSFPDPSLSILAGETGGGYIEVRPREDLGAAFARVADELHHQYLLGFTLPTRDGKTHKLEVKLNQSGMTARTRKTYVAPKG